MVLLAAVASACGGDAAPTPAAVARVGQLVLDAAVVEHIAARDGLSEAQARDRALDTLRLVAAARHEHEARGDDPGPTVAPMRAAHLRRGARARLWLQAHFEPAHRPQDIPDDDPMLVRARSSSRHVHPALSTLCQVLVLPAAPADDPDAPASPDDPRARDPQWQKAARDAVAPLLARIERNVPPDDPEACSLIEREFALSEQPDDPRVRITFEGLGGFDLDACLRERDDGTCSERQFEPTWTEAVRAASAPGPLPPLFTPFGLHLVHLQGTLPARLADDPATEQAIRAEVHDAWRARTLAAEIDRMGKAAGLRLVLPTEDGS